MADEQIVTSIVAKADLSSLVSEVHRATASLQQLQRELLTSNKSIAAATKVANNAFRDTLIGSGLYSSHFVNLQSDVDKFGKQLDAGRLKLKDYASTFRTHFNTQKGLIRELAKEQVMLQNAVLQPLGRNAQGLMQYNVMIPRGLDAVKSSAQLARMEMQIMNRALSEGATSLINWGKNTQWAGRQLTVGLTVPLAMFGTQAAKAFREADQELTRLIKVYGDIAGTASADLQKIRQDVTATAKELASTMGVSFKETIGLAADIAATGQQGDQLLSSLKETTRLAVLGEVDRAEAMKATLAIQTAFKSNTQELTESINFLNAVENQTSTTLNDLVEAIPKAGTVVKQLGGDVEDLALYLTAMREGGVNASEAANALKSGLASMINPTKQTVGLMADFGIDVLGMVERNAGNTTGMILDLQKALDGLDPLSKARALEQMFGKFQFARMAALFNNLGKEGSQTLQVMELMGASAEQLANIAGRELTLVTESASGKYRRAIEGLRASLADVGEEFLGVATKFINAFAKVLDFFNNLPEPIKKAVTFLGGFTAVIGPIIMLTGVLANFFGYITKGIVQLRAFFQRAAGWKMLTPEIIAAEKASLMVEKAFYSDAAAAEVLHGALTKLIADYANLQRASLGGAIPVNPVVNTVGGSTIMSPIRRVVDPEDAYAGALDTRAMSHINPRDPNNPASFLGGVPGAIPVNQKIGRTPQIYMHDRLPNVPGLTSVGGVSTGLVAGEAARFHALMATLAMQTEAEVAALKKTISLGGTVSADLLGTFDDILPITSRIADGAANQSAAIVAELRAGKITLEAAKAKIIALNAQIEAMMKSELSIFAASRGRTIDFTKAPLMNQPVVDAHGQFTLRDLYKKESNRAVMEEFGRLRGIRTFGAPYSIQTTRLPKFNPGGQIESFGPNKTVVSGSTSINYDDRLGSVPVGGYVLNQSAAMNPANADLAAAAPATHMNDGGNITAALTPGEIVFGRGIQDDPELLARVDAANRGIPGGEMGGTIRPSQIGYGLVNMAGWMKIVQGGRKFTDKQVAQARLNLINERYIDDRFVPGDPSRLGINAARKVRTVAHDANILINEGLTPQQAFQVAIADYEAAIAHSTIKSGFRSGMVDNRKWKDIRSQQAKQIFGDKIKKYRSRRSVQGINPLKSTIDYMMKNPELFGGAEHVKRILTRLKLIDSSGKFNKNNIVASEHTDQIENFGWQAPGNYGQAQFGERYINEASNHLRRTTSLRKGTLGSQYAGFSFFPDRHIMSDAGFDAYNRALRGNFGYGARELLGRPISSENRGISRMLAPTRDSIRDMFGRSRPQDIFEIAGLRFAANMGGMIPGGMVRRNKAGYGLGPMSLLTPEKMLRVLTTSKELSSKKALGEFAGLPTSSYSHQIAPSSGKSYPIPGVSGIYKNSKGELVFVKGVPNAITAKAEMYGTRMSREVFGLDSPTQTIRALVNPYDPTGKSKLLGLESRFDPKYSAGGTKFTEDQMIRQTIASLLMGNKDLSRSNVFGNILADVGPAGVFPRASMNTAYAESMNSMEKQALINLLAVRGGARKDFAHNTSSIAAGMTPRQYGARMKSAMKNMHPKLKAFIASLPESDRAPYIAMLGRLEDGMKVNWSKYQQVHANPPFNRGGRIPGYNRGGGIVSPGRRNYGVTDGQRSRYDLRGQMIGEKMKVDRVLLGVNIPNLLGKIFGDKNNLRGAEIQNALRSSAFGRSEIVNAPNQAGANTRAFVPGSYLPLEPSVSRLLSMGMPGFRAPDKMQIPLIRMSMAIDKAFSKLAPVMTKLVNAIQYQTKIIEARPALEKPVLKGTVAEAKQPMPTRRQAFWWGFQNAGALTTGQPDALKSLARVPAGHPSLAAAMILNNRLNVGPMDMANTFNPYKAVLPSIGRATGRIGTGFSAVRGHPDLEMRKREGFLGFRKKEYRQVVTSPDGQMVVGEDGRPVTRTLTSEEARARGLGGFGLGQGGQFGMMMGGQVAGMAMMQRKPEDKIFGMNPQAAGMTTMITASILPFMMGKDGFISKAPARIKAMGMNMTAALRTPISQSAQMATRMGQLAGTLQKVGKAGEVAFRFLHVAKFLGPIGAVISGITTLFTLYRKFNDWNQDAANRFGLTKKAAEELGVEYFNLADRMKAMTAAQAAMRASALAGAKVGVPGMYMDPQKAQALKDEAGAKFKESIETINRADAENINQVINNLKAQMIGLGLSAEETNKNILGMMMASKNSDLAFKVFSDGGFKSIVDRASSAKFIFKNLSDELNNPGDQFGTKMIEGFSSLINITDLAIKNLTGTKDAAGNLITEADAVNKVMKDMANNPAFSQQIGYRAFNQLPDEFKEILNYSDSIGGAIAKWRLQVSGTTLNLKEMTSEAAIALAAWGSAISTATDNLQKAGGTASTFGTIGTALSKINKITNEVSRSAQRAFRSSQQNAQEEIKLLQKKIQLIEDEKNKKLEALRATRDAQNYELNLQKLQLQYQDAIASGDMVRAAELQIEIRQLTADRQMQLAEQAIEDAANKAKKPLTKKTTSVQESQDKKSAGMQAAQDRAEDAGAAAEKIKGFETRYERLLADRSVFESQKDQKMLMENKSELDDLMKQIQTSGTAKGPEAKYIREAFADLFTKEGKAKNLFTPTTSVAYSGGGLSVQTSTNRDAIDSMYKRDLAAVTKEANRIVEGITGGMTLSELAVALGAKPPKDPTPRKVGAGARSGRQDMPADDSPSSWGSWAASNNTAPGRVFGTKPNRYIYDANRAAVYEAKDLAKFKEVAAKYNVKYNKGGPIGMPRYNVGGPITSSRRMYGNPPPSNNALYNINVELNGSNLDAKDVARAIRKEMEAREMMSGPGRRY